MSNTIGDILFTAAIICLAIFLCGLALLATGSDPYAAVRGENVPDALKLLGVGGTGFVIAGSFGMFFK